MTSRDNRASALGWGLAFLTVLPAPDGALDQGDRQQVMATYRGVLAGASQPALDRPLSISGHRLRPHLTIDGHALVARMTVSGHALVATMDAPAAALSPSE